MMFFLLLLCLCQPVAAIEVAPYFVKTAEPASDEGSDLSLTERLKKTLRDKVEASMRNKIKGVISDSVGIDVTQLEQTMETGRNGLEHVLKMGASGIKYAKNLNIKNTWTLQQLSAEKVHWTFTVQARDTSESAWYPVFSGEGEAEKPQTECTVRPVTLQHHQDNAPNLPVDTLEKFRLRICPTERLEYLSVHLDVYRKLFLSKKKDWRFFSPKITIPTQLAKQDLRLYQHSHLIHAAYRMYQLQISGKDIREALPKEYRLHGVIMGNPSFSPISSVNRDIYGFLAEHITSNNRYIIVRGSESRDDWLRDAQAWQVTWDKATDNPDQPVKVHKGFLSVYESLTVHDADSVAKSISSGVSLKPSERKIHTIYKDWVQQGQHVYVVGHSLGGALASLLAVDLTKHVSATNTMHLLTLASPKVGNLAFVQAAKGIAEIKRIENVQDIVPHLPQGMQSETYYSLGQPVLYSTYFDAALSHSMMPSQAACWHSYKTYLWFLGQRVEGAKDTLCWNNDTFDSQNERLSEEGVNEQILH